MIGNIFALPGIIVEASCEGGGVLEDEEVSHLYIYIYIYI